LIRDVGLAIECGDNEQRRFEPGWLTRESALEAGSDVEPLRVRRVVPLQFREFRTVEFRRWGRDIGNTTPTTSSGYVAA